MQKKPINFLVGFNGAEFPLRNQRRHDSPPNTVNCTVCLAALSRPQEHPAHGAATNSRPIGSRTSGEISIAGRMRLMLLAGSALGASPPHNLCSLASVPFGGIVRHRHGPYPHPPRLEKTFFIKALSVNAPDFLIPLRYIMRRAKNFSGYFEDFRICRGCAVDACVRLQSRACAEAFKEPSASQ